MAKSVDYSKIKAMAQSILECIGDDEEGANPSLPAQKQDINAGGQDKMKAFISGVSSASEREKLSSKEDATDVCEPDSDSDDENKKKRSIAMMTSMLKSKFNS